MREPDNRRPIGERDILFKAATEIERRGHAKGTWQDKSGRVSALGAVKLAALGRIVGCAVDDHPIARGAYERFRLAVGGDGMAWNDEPERSGADVAEKLKQVAMKLVTA
jgi:hypothetical protein